MESKKINQLATELAPELSDLTIIGDPTTGISKKITLSQMASLFTGTVEEYANLASFPLVGTADTIYIALNTNIIYRWNTGTSAYVELSPNIVTSLVFNDANGFDGTISLVGSTATLTITTALTQGSIGFIGASGALLEDNANFFWNNSTKRLGINTNAPTTAIDVFGSGIIGRLNGTSTNNAFLGFASAGSNKWSIGNVQSDHRFRIYNEANTAELVSVLQTGEFGIGIANPLTKLHIFGGASALIANLDANTSVAKSISFRSGNSSRFNIEVSGTESGSNAGMDFYLRAYTDAGALLSTPLTISRSTGAVTLSSSLSATGATFTSTQTNLILNTTTNTSFTKLSFQENGSEKATITYPNSTFGAPTRREKLEISNLGGISFITQNAPLSPNLSITSAGYINIANNTAQLLPISSINFQILSGCYYDGSNIIAAATSGNRIINSSGNFQFNTFTGATVGASVSDTEKFRITSSGNVGIGTSSPNYSAANRTVLDINGTNESLLSFSNGGTQRGYIYSTSSGQIFWAEGSRNMEFGIAGAGYMGFGTNNTERMRITSGGNLLFTGGVSTFVTDTKFLMVSQGTTSATYAMVIKQSNNTTNLFLVRDDGLIQTGTASGSPYNNTSGAAANLVVNSAGTLERATSSLKYKTDIVNYDKGLAEVLKMRPVYYKSINEREKDLRFAGLIAEEIEELGLTEFVQYAEDGTPDALAYSNMISLLTKAIQEQQAQIEELKALINK